MIARFAARGAGTTLVSRFNLVTMSAVFVIALLVRIVHLWELRDTVFFSVLLGDARGYDAWAQRLAAGDWIGTEVFYQAPLYPYFVGVVYSLFGHDLLALRVVQALLGSLSPVAVAMAVATLMTPRAGLIAGVMLATYPPAIFADFLVQKSVLDVLFVCIAVALVAHIVVHGHTRAGWLGLGVVIGALALTRENALVLAVVLAAWAVASLPASNHDRGAAAVFRRIGPFIVGLTIVLLPVAIRNFVVSGGWYLTTSQFGSNLYIGNNPRADGSYVALREGRGSPEYERLDATALAEQATGRPLTPSEVSAYWTSQTLAFIRAQPIEWLELLARKTRLLLSRTEIIDTESQESHAEHSLPLRVLGAIWHFGILAPLAAIGFLVCWRQRSRWAPFYLLAVTYALSVITFYVVARYRLPWVPLLIPFAVAGVLAMPRLRREMVGVGVAIAVLANWPTHSAASQQAITENNLGAVLQEAGRLDEAVDHYRRALTLSPAFTPAMTNLGTALRAQGRTDQAISLYDAALANGQKAHPSLYLNRGNALMQQGRIADAIESFRRAVAGDSGSLEARRALANALYDQGTTALEAGAPGQAEALLRESIALRGDYVEAHNNLGIALASQGKLSEAIVQWEAALAVDPSFHDARRNLEMARKAR